MVLLNQACLVSPLPETPGRSVFPVVSSHMRGEQPADPGRYVPIASGPNDQVHMIWHKARCEYRHLQPILRFPHVFEECGKVGAAVKHPSLLIAAIDDVITLVRGDHSQGSGHAAS
jgi:hypothetical protein